MLYHYTTIEALFSIIEQISTETDIDECGRRNEHWVLPLRATHIGFLNDSTEGSLLTHALAGMKVSQEAVKSAALQNGKQYVLSFSKKKDDLNMWRSYSDDGYGVMLGFDRDRLEKHVNELYKNDNPMSLAMPVVDCDYVGNEGISVKQIEDKDFERNRFSIANMLKNKLGEVHMKHIRFEKSELPYV